MPSQGPLNPGTLADDAAVGTITWGSPGNAAASDDTRASASSVGNAISHYLKATNFGFTIPSGATIDGIVVEIEKSEGAADDNITDEHVKIVKGGTVGATNRADTVTEWGTADAYATYGSSTDLWGETWADTDINATTFGAVIASDQIGIAIARVDHIRITVYYTEGAVTRRPQLPFVGLQAVNRAARF